MTFAEGAIAICNRPLLFRKSMIAAAVPVPAIAQTTARLVLSATLAEIVNG